MKTNRVEFIKTLESVQSGLVSKSVFEQMTHFVFTQEHLMTFNGQIGMIRPFESDIEGSVRAEELMKILKKIKEKNVTVKVMEKENSLLVLSKTTKAKLPIIFSDELQTKIQPIVDGIKNKLWKPIPERFEEGVKLGAISASNDLTLGTLTCVLFEENYILSGDNTRIGKYTVSEEPCFKNPFMVRAEHLLEVINLGISSYQVGKSFVYFQTEDGMIISTIRIRGDYPSEMFNSVFDQKFKPVLKSVPEELNELLETVEIVNKDIVTLTCSKENNELTCESRGEHGWIKRKIPFKAKRDFSFVVNPKLLKEILEKTTSMSLSENAILLKSGSFSHLISKKRG